MPALPFRRPPSRTTAGGAVRRVGVEVEFTGLDPQAAADLVRDLYGGEVVADAPHRRHVRGTRHGDFTAELDMRSAHPPAGAPPGGMAERLREVWGGIGGLLMPVEISAPPIPLDDLPDLEALVDGLRARGAVGTDGGALYAFGLHLNPEVVELGSRYLLDHLKAFVTLSPWLRAQVRVDPTRRISGFVAPFPASYAWMVADPAYRPDLNRLIDDYLDANPTRSREFDLCPIIALLAPERLAASVRDSRIRPRPTFHYRLPNTALGDAEWSLAAEWNRWVAVEDLAADAERLDRLALRYRVHAEAGTLPRWAEALTRIVG